MKIVCEKMDNFVQNELKEMGFEHLIPVFAGKKKIFCICMFVFKSKVLGACFSLCFVSFVFIVFYVEEEIEEVSFKALDLETIATFIPKKGPQLKFWSIFKKRRSEYLYDSASESVSLVLVFLKYYLTASLQLVD